MITCTDITRVHYPEVGDRDIEDAACWMILVDPVRWGVLHILQHYLAEIKIAVFLILLLH